MDIIIDALIPFEKIEKDPKEVFLIVEKYGQAVLLQNNAPVYIIIKPGKSVEPKDESDNFPLQLTHSIKPSTLTLQEAMRVVLLDATEHKMHAAQLADTIYERGLYVQKNGEKAKYNQMRARCGHYPEMFEALKGNIIRLRTENSENIYLGGTHDD